MRMFNKILIANRGEIACRIIRTARRMGLATVAVHSDADRDALHVAMADEAVRIGPAPAAQSYLAGDRIIEAAKATGAEAIHPGYGFLSENPDFAKAVEAAGLVFVGPTPASIRAMGLKDAAKRLMEKAGVPVVPGYHGEGQEIIILATKAREIGYPVLIKARAGGGGKGMRRVDDPDDFAEALASARREAKAAFGDDRVLVEKWIERPRHIEVQVFGDAHGNVVHLYERDCSLQRRHQKVIEEAPAPGMDDATRAAMTGAAIAAAKAISYRGAGTVEFIVDASEGLRPDRFWFMEMNTRLQVEHPVTEMVTGVDLVEWQLRIAAGGELPLGQDRIGLTGHAFEARIYAEDPARDFLPATGTLHRLAFPSGDGIRVETGVREGDTIPPHYDPMIAKLVAHGPDRDTALARLGEALDLCRVAGATVNLGFLSRLAREPSFAAGEVDTGLIGREQEALTRPVRASFGELAKAAVSAAGFLPATGQDPWSRLTGYGHFHALRRQVQLDADGQNSTYVLSPQRDGRVLVEGDGRSVRLDLADVQRDTARWPGHVTVFGAGTSHDVAFADPLAQAAATGEGADALRAPMPGLVKLVRAEPGQAVRRGQPLLVLEAMKMEHAISAPRDGTIETIAREGDQVSEGTALAVFRQEPDETQN
jgi:3-methylcrotonyl-CoA carboxylase alpha subunit